MALKIRTPNTNIKPGSFFGGTITSLPDAGRLFDVDIFTVNLLGVVKPSPVTDLRSHQTSVTFLDLRQVIHRGPIELERGHVCHFDLILPEDPAHETDTRWGGIFHSLHSRPPAQALPPSGDFGPGYQIEYRLEAVLVDKNSQTNIEACTVLSFFKTRSVENPNPQMTTTVEKKIFGGQARMFEAEYLGLALESPQVVVQGLAFPLMLRLIRSGIISSSTFTVPTVLLKSCHIRLLANASIKNEDKIPTQVQECRLLATCDTRATDPNVETGYFTENGLDLGMLLGKPVIPSSCSPSFDCSNVKCTHSFIIEVSVECGDQTFDARFEPDPVMILASEYANVERDEDEGVGFTMKRPEGLGWDDEFWLINDEFH
ncbi:MAG: hypothetical protein Q9201_002880 [Fulgogasparrea decipioides]